jgi:hypothetical protein
VGDDVCAGLVDGQLEIIAEICSESLGAMTDFVYKVSEPGQRFEFSCECDLAPSFHIAIP